MRIYGDPARKNSLSRRCHVRPFIALCLVCLLFLALPACDRGGDNSVTGLEGSPIALRLQRATGGASDFVGEGPFFAINPEGCSEECGDENREEPKYVEIMVSVDGRDAVTIYNGDFSSSVTVSVPNGDVLLLVFIYNCDCCEAFEGFHEMSLPDDGGEVLVEIFEVGPYYEFTYSRDDDGDNHPDENIAVDFCKEPTEEGWVPECTDLDFNCDCDDGDPEINLDADEVCDDDADNDCDGDVDCDDEDCFVFGPCQN
jgi:hypothetical protein